MSVTKYEPVASRRHPPLLRLGEERPQVRYAHTHVGLLWRGRGLCPAGWHEGTPTTAAGERSCRKAVVDATARLVYDAGHVRP